MCGGRTLSSASVSSASSSRNAVTCGSSCGSDGIDGRGEIGPERLDGGWNVRHAQPPLLLAGKLDTGVLHHQDLFCDDLEAGVAKGVERFDLIIAHARDEPDARGGALENVLQQSGSELLVRLVDEHRELGHAVARLRSP